MRLFARCWQSRVGMVQKARVVKLKASSTKGRSRWNATGSLRLTPAVLAVAAVSSVPAVPVVRAVFVVPVLAVLAALACHNVPPELAVPAVPAMERLAPTKQEQRTKQTQANDKKQ